MQSSETMGHMMRNLMQYIMMPKFKYARAVGTYVSYDIAAYDCDARDIVEILLDVTADSETALCAWWNRSTGTSLTPAT